MTTFSVDLPVVHWRIPNCFFFLQIFQRNNSTEIEKKQWTVKIWYGNVGFFVTKMEMKKKKKYFEPASQKFPEFTRVEVEKFINIFEQVATNGAISRTKYNALFDLMGMKREFFFFVLLYSFWLLHLPSIKKWTVRDQDIQLATGHTGSLSWNDFLKIQRYLNPQKKIEFENEFMKPAITAFPEFSKLEILNFAAAFRTFGT